MISPKKIYVIAGEASGDLHTANLIAAWNNLNHNLNFRGIGGDRMLTQGVSLNYHIKETNFMGFWEVFQNLRKIYQIFRNTCTDIDAYRPDAILLVDYPGFNLRIAKKLGADYPIYYYISPQLWAWKKGRIKILKQYVKKLITILPFEQSFYEKEAVHVDYVGHPLLDAIEQYKQDKQDNSTNLRIDSPRPILALLPGSRKQEVKRMLPIMLQALKQLPNYQGVLVVAPTLPLSFYESILAQFPLVGNEKVLLYTQGTYAILAQAAVAFVTSGTATLETALWAVPQAVCYKGEWLSYQLARRLIQVPYISLVNLILDAPLVPELIQTQLTPANLVEFVRKTEDIATKTNIINGYTKLKELLGGAGASERAAHLLNQYLLE